MKAPNVCGFNFIVKAFIIIPFSLALLFLLSISAFASDEHSQSPNIKDNTDTHINLSEENTSIDDLLGPKDNFPFLPDNHRDSGTGKFSMFN